MCERFRREQIAWYLIACMDTVTLATPEEVNSIHARAQAGEFDDVQYSGVIRQYEGAS